jgi:hypothetical protein
MRLQILTLKLDGITAGDYLTWCRDPEPPALDFALRSISIDADPVGDTITAILAWNESPPPTPAAADAAGLPLSMDVQLDAMLTETSHSGLVATSAGSDLTGTAAALLPGADVDAVRRLPRKAGVEGQRRTAA